MSPTLLDGQLVLVVRPVFPWNRLRRSDVAVLTPPSRTPGLPEGTWFIKRVAGMPDEEIVLSGGNLYADDVLLADLSRADLGEPGQRREWWKRNGRIFRPRRQSW